MGRILFETITERVEVTDAVTDTFFPRLARDWLVDVQRETDNENIRSARRRQIVAAAIFADCYLFEWVRDEVLVVHDDRWERLFDLFPANDRRGVVERWKKLPKQLAEKRLIDKDLDRSTDIWQEFVRLVDYRNGLVHGKASRPDGSHLPSKWAPTPSMNDLNELDPEWAYTKVVALVEHLHEVAGTSPPDWDDWLNR